MVNSSEGTMQRHMKHSSCKANCLAFGTLSWNEMQLRRLGVDQGLEGIHLGIPYGAHTHMRFQ